MRKPIIGIVGRPDTSSDGYPSIYVFESTRKAVIRCGGNPILILPPKMIDYQDTKSKDIEPITDDEKEALIEALNLCDGILMPGGFRWYEHDKFICDYVIKYDIPLLGLCLGMQIMSCYNSDYSLEKNDENGFNHFQRGIKYLHKVNIVDGTKLKSILGDISSMEVNSRHNYHITKTNEFIPSAYSFDGLIEAIEHPNKRFIMGLQWHPEVMTEYDEINKKLFTAFIDACRK
jgi:putative glutamine amidotransferase